MNKITNHTITLFFDSADEVEKFFELAEKRRTEMYLRDDELEELDTLLDHVTFINGSFADGG